MAISARAPAILLGAAFLTFFDRGLMPPLLTAIADDWGVSVADVGPALTGHFLAYGLVQLLWAMLSSRVGQLRVLRVSLSLAVLGSVVSAVAFDPVSLTIARTVAGAGFGATVPATLVFFAETVPLARRGTAMANLATALALGMTAGTAAASLLAPFTAWRWAFAATALFGLGVVALVWRLRAPVPSRAPLSVARGLGVLLRDGWSVLVLALAVVEGMLLVGIIAFLPIALEFAGEERALAGIVTSTFGIAVVLAAQVVKLVFVRTRPWVPLLVGGVTIVAGYTILGVHVALATVIVASIVFGFAWATAHTQLQTWMTDAVSRARPVGAALFGMALFGGGALGAWLGTVFAASEQFGLLFLIAAVCGGVFTAAAVAGRVRYREREER
jgi:predicted MFS family arabinose efflux permease